MTLRATLERTPPAIEYRVDRIFLKICLVLLCTSFGGCQDYLARRDTLTIGSGDAVHTNAAMHVLDPWPPHARTVESSMNGERLQHAMERYRNPGIGQQNALIVPQVPIGSSSTPTSAPFSSR